MEIDDGLVVGIKVEDELLFVGQTIVEGDEEVNLVLAVGKGRALIIISVAALVVHHIVVGGIGGTGNEVVDGYALIDLARIAQRLYFLRSSNHCLGLRLARSDGCVVGCDVGIVECGKAFGLGIVSLLLALVGHEFLYLAIKVRHNLAHALGPFGREGVGLLDGVVDVLHTLEHIHVAETYGRGIGIVALHAHFGHHGLVVPLYSGFERGVDDDVGQHMAQAVAEGEQDARHRGRNSGVGGHTEIVGEKGVVAPLAFFARVGAIALIGGESLHLGHLRVHTVAQGAVGF